MLLYLVSQWWVSVDCLHFECHFIKCRCTECHYTVSLSAEWLNGWMPDWRYVKWHLPEGHYIDYCYRVYLRYAGCFYTECNYVECHYAKCHYAKCHYAKCLYAKCHYAKCHYRCGVVTSTRFYFDTLLFRNVITSTINEKSHYFDWQIESNLPSDTMPWCR